jgi:hypothetical protein
MYASYCGLLSKSMALSLLVASSCPFLCAAQTSPAQALRYKNQRAPMLVEKDMPVPEPMPDVPRYSGQCKFDTGHTFETAAGTTYRERWYVREEKNAVLDWYRQALSSVGYKVENSSICSIFGSKNSGTVELSVLDIPKPGYRCQLTLFSYHKR